MQKLTFHLLLLLRDRCQVFCHHLAWEIVSEIDRNPDNFDPAWSAGTRLALMECMYQTSSNEVKVPDY